MEAMKLSIVLPKVEDRNVPFGHLRQLSEVGIYDIYILLNNAAYKQVHEKKFRLFDGFEPQTIIGHYKSYNPKFNVVAINTGDAITEEDKLTFFLEHVNKEHDLNIFLGEELTPWVSEDLSAKFPEVIEKSLCIRKFAFYKGASHQKLPLFDAPCSSEPAKALLARTSNPTICYKMSYWDLQYHQWLFNVFVELITLEISRYGHKYGEFAGKFEKLITDYNRFIAEFDKAERDYEKSHKAIYPRGKNLHANSKSLQKRHEKNVKRRNTIDRSFPEVIKELIELFGEIKFFKYGMSIGQ